MKRTYRVIDGIPCIIVPDPPIHTGARRKRVCYCVFGVAHLGTEYVQQLVEYIPDILKRAYYYNSYPFEGYETVFRCLEVYD